jgi:hypothetical protein
MTRNDNGKLLRLVGKLSVGEQQDVLDGKRFPVVEQVLDPEGRPGGPVTHRMVAVEEMDADQLKRVFASRHIRTVPEQTARLEAKRLAEAQEAAREKVGPFTLDRELKTATDRGRTYSLAELEAAVQALKRKEAPAGPRPSDRPEEG